VIARAIILPRCRSAGSSERSRFRTLRAASSLRTVWYMRCVAVASLAFVVVPLAVAFDDLRPRTVAELPGLVHGEQVAVGSRAIGWIASHQCPIRLLDLRTHRTHTIKDCSYAEYAYLTVARGRLVWVRYGGGNTELAGGVMTATVNDRTPRGVASFDFIGCEVGAYCRPAEIATDGVSVVFSLPNEVRKLAGTRSLRLFKNGGGAAFGPLAIGGGLLAVARYPSQPGPARIELRGFPSGALKRVIDAPEVPSAVSSTLLAASDTRRIDLYDTNTGRHIAHARGNGNGDDIQVILLGRRAIFATSNRLQALDADTRRVTTLVHAAHPITNVQLAFTSEGARVAWTEETARGTAVRELR
jgi:hypothetical protein